MTSGNDLRDILDINIHEENDAVTRESLFGENKKVIIQSIINKNYILVFS